MPRMTSWLARPGQWQRAHGFGNGIISAAVWPTRESAAGVHAASPGLQHGGRPGHESQHESRIHFDFLSVLQTSGKINLWLTISKRKVRKALTFSITWA